ncbi:MAG: hypothetical protein WBR26_27795, partial [Candidatus Acidiferrum sp.]
CVINNRSTRVAVFGPGVNKVVAHISQAEARSHVKAGRAEWIREPQSRRDAGLIRMVGVPKRGLSLLYGETLAEALRAHEPWAQTMMSQISTR